MSELLTLKKQLEREKKLSEILKLQLRNLQRAQLLNEDLDLLAAKIKSGEEA